MAAILYAVLMFFIEIDRSGEDKISFFYYISLAPTIVAYFVLEKKTNVIKRILISMILYQQCTSWYSSFHPSSDPIEFPDYIIRYLKLTPHTFLMGTGIILFVHLILWLVKKDHSPNKV